MDDDLRPGPPPVPSERAVAASSSKVVVMSVVALVIGATRSLTWPAAITVSGVGLVVCYSALTRPVERAPSPAPGASTSGLVVWATIFVVFCLWELAAFLIGNNAAHPTWSMLSDPVLTWVPTRAVAAFAWIAWGERLVSQ
jgi:hypothetical protein